MFPTPGEKEEEEAATYGYLGAYLQSLATTLACTDSDPTPIYTSIHKQGSMDKENVEPESKA